MGGCSCITASVSVQNRFFTRFISSQLGQRVVSDTETCSQYILSEAIITNGVLECLVLLGIIKTPLLPSCSVLFMAPCWRRYCSGTLNIVESVVWLCAFKLTYFNLVSIYFYITYSGLVEFFILAQSVLIVSDRKTLNGDS
jgi:hypothetical protein